MGLRPYDGTTPLSPTSTPVELRRLAAALGGGGRAGRDGDAVDIVSSLCCFPTNQLRLRSTQHQRTTKCQGKNK